MTDKHDKMDDDDMSLLAREMSDVKPLKQNRTKAPIQKPSGKSSIPEFTLKLRRRQATTENSITADGLSDTHIVPIAPEEYMEHMQTGLQHTKMRKLRLGQIKVEYNLDLHGFSFEDGREMLQRFISFCRKNHYTTVRVVHGKSHNAWEPNGAIKNETMKSYVNAWLKQVPGVLGFASCLPVDGGTGAVYVLLSRPR